MCEYKHALLSEKQYRAATKDRELQLRILWEGNIYMLMYMTQWLNRAKLLGRGHKLITVVSFDVGSIVQVPLYDVDTTKADGKNLTLVVVEVV
jgi:hypothetical protein